MSNSGKKKAADDDDEVEQLLRAAQDDMLLKLNLNSHMARGSSAAAIDSDLDRRFLALKKPQKPPKVDDPTKSVPAKADSGGSGVDGASDDDLFARFTALKNTIPSHKSNLSGDAPANQPAAEEEEESEDEVEKVMKWAIDAARLDPSQPSDDDDDDDDYDCSDDDDDCSDDDDDDVNGKKKKKRK